MQKESVNPDIDLNPHPFQKFFNKYLWVFILINLIALFFLIFFLTKDFSCSDGTLNGECSGHIPFYCKNGILLSKASICGCPENFEIKGDFCFSKYLIDGKNIFLKYHLKGLGVINFMGYKGFYNYTKNLPRTISSDAENASTLKDLKLLFVKDDSQKNLLLPIVIKIINNFENKEDQVKAAISLVQSIPYGVSKRVTEFHGKNITLPRYPYEVLYENEGSCGEKSALLSILLNQMGYGVAIFYFPEENHEAVGIKCPDEIDFQDTGYCFIETTAPLKKGDNYEYFGATKNFSTKPQVIKIFDGETFNPS